METPIIKEEPHRVTVSYNGTCSNKWVMGYRYAWRESPCPFKACALYVKGTDVPFGPMFGLGLLQSKRGMKINGKVIPVFVKWDPVADTSRRRDTAQPCPTGCVVLLFWTYLMVVLFSKTLGTHFIKSVSCIHWKPSSSKINSALPCFESIDEPRLKVVCNHLLIKARFIHTTLVSVQMYPTYKKIIDRSCINIIVDVTLRYFFSLYLIWTRFRLLIKLCDRCNSVNCQ